MLSTGASPHWASVDVAVPRRPDRLPGIGMAGFRRRAPGSMDIAMVAHPSVTLLIDLSDRGDGDCLAYDLPGRRVHGSAVIGLLPRDLRIIGRGSGECLQIRLVPAVAARLFGAPSELTGRLVPLDDVWGGDAGRAEDRLRGTTSWDERFAIVRAVLGRRLDARHPVDPEVVHAWRTLARRGPLRVDRLAEDVGWSRQRLWSRFRSQLGITPKRAARLVRFDRAAHLLAAGHPPAAVAAATGYADQSHLHRDVAEFAGLTPSSVAAAPWLAVDDVAWPG